MSQPKPATSTERRRRDDRGSVSIELIVILPALFAVMFLGVQAALYYHARTVAIAGAQEGARAAGAEYGRTSDGIRAAHAFIADAGGSDVLPGASVTGDRTGTVATVRVVGKSLSVIPGWSPVVRQSASVPVERLTAP
jgi:Flp pilus assembly protein TadG